jgi:hypothetical protein
MSFFDLFRRRQDPNPILSASPQFTLEVMHALDRFLGASTLTRKQALLEQEQGLLLTQVANEILTTLMDEAERTGNPEEHKRALYMKVHRTLLRRAQEIGISAAWTEFLQVIGKI